MLNELADAVDDDFEPTYPMLWEDSSANLDDRQSEVSGCVEEVLEAIQQLAFEPDFPARMLISAIREDVDGLAAVVTSAEPAEQTLVARTYALLDYADRINSGGTVLALLDSAPVRREPEPAGPDFSSSADFDGSDTVDTALEATATEGARDGEVSPDTRASAIGSPDDDTGRDDTASRHSGPTADHTRPDGLNVEHGPAPRRPLSWDTSSSASASDGHSPGPSSLRQLSSSRFGLPRKEKRECPKSSRSSASWRCSFSSAWRLSSSGTDRDCGGETT